MREDLASTGVCLRGTPGATLVSHAVPLMMQMNTVKHMDPARAAALFGAFGAPASPPLHPNLRQLRDEVLSRIDAYDRLCEIARGMPEMTFESEGLVLTPRAKWETAYRIGAEALTDVQMGRWRPYIRTVRKHFPALSVSFEESFDRSAEALREIQGLLAHLLGLPTPEGADDLSIPFPEDAGPGPSVALDL